MKSARGTAHGAITILNATATGRGCALAIDAPTHATWSWGGRWDWRGTTDDALASAVRDVVLEAGGAALRSAAPNEARDPSPGGTNGSREDLGILLTGARADCRSPFPPSRGLKTSSAAATAMLRAASQAAGVTLSPDRLDALAVQAARTAGVTITGALDDQMAVSRGGCHLTDNRAGTRLRSFRVPAWHVAVWVPKDSVAKAQVAGIDIAPAVEGADEALGLLETGDVPGALQRNGEVFHALYASAGLPVDDAPTEAALAAGALGAGLSGTGPAVAALFAAPTDLPPVPGGTWQWFRAVPA